MIGCEKIPRRIRYVSPQLDLYHNNNNDQKFELSRDGVIKQYAGKVNKPTKTE